MQRLLRLCLWQALVISISCFSLPISAEEGGIRIRGPKSTDAFPYDRYGPITAKDTLWNIALKVRPDPRLSVYQVMQSLYENNPQSFKDNNLNHMVNGQYLKIPSIDAMRAIDSANAQQKSRSDDKVWQKKVKSISGNKMQAPEKMTVNKKDLEQAKSEINVQLKAIGSSQQERLTTIQNDVLDSIDGLQSLLKENENLRQRLSSFNDQLGIMQNEVAKGKEIKIQMDDMIALQQELLAKAEAREQELLLEKQKVDLKRQSFASSTWFLVLMATLPAMLILSLFAFFMKRRATQPINEHATSSKKSKNSKANTEENQATPDGLENELSLDDKFSLDSELSLDDELSIDLKEDDDHDDLFADGLDSLEDELLDDDVIHLDDSLDDLDDLDDLEDISLDDDILEAEALETISLDDDIVDDEPLAGGQLDQNDLDSLLSGIDEPTDDTASTAEVAPIDVLEGGVLDQDMLDSLLDEDALTEGNEDLLNVDNIIDEINDNNADAISDVDTQMSDPDDIDALLDAVSQDAPAPEAALVDNADTNADMNTDINADMNVAMSDPDDIDALLDAVSQDAPAPEAELVDNADTKADMNVAMSDPDDIDALLDAVSQDAPAPEAALVDNADTNADMNPDMNADMNVAMSDPDDIDALLDAVSQDAPAPEAALVDNADTKADMNVAMSDPDDIDALLDAVSQDVPASETALVDNADMNPDMNVAMSDPDDIDALLDAVSQDAPAPEAALVDNADTNADMNADMNTDMNVAMSDPDDIDALLDAVSQDAPAPEAALVDNADTKADMNVAMSDPDDIDALLDAVSQDAPAPEAELVDNADTKADMNVAMSDPDDIDALLDAVSQDVPASETALVDNADMNPDMNPDMNTDMNTDMNVAMSDPDDIDALLDAMGSAPVSMSERNQDKASETSEQQATEAITDKTVNSAERNNENAALIDNFSDEYIESFLNADLSDVLDEFVEESAEDDTATAKEQEQQANDVSPQSSHDGAISDDFDIDALIEEVNHSNEHNDDSILDIGDDLLDNQSDETSPFIDDETLKQLSADFDETTLTQLLNDEKESDTHVELSPDFTDSNVLADLLADDNENDSVNPSELPADNVIEEIKALDNVDFDDLLANIEEETTPTNDEDNAFELSDNFDIGDDINDIANENEDESDNDSDNKAQDEFVSVDSLLSDSLLDTTTAEPFESMSVDVGLGEFPEFAGNVDGDDIDDDDKGIAAKLDLAKVYIEIGDHENAEVILQDVIEQGDAQQQSDAQKLLDNIN